MATVGLYKDETRLSELQWDALAGQDIDISRNGKPAVHLIPVEASLPEPEFGYYREGVRIAKDYAKCLEI
ncbi:MAG TPA: type II toxin-antitoxin system prevent-host-death family antitoxin [Treponema sp.]|nr:MAG: hypothetical protein A2413_02660 [Treponema sp. RIFOXYC1_FULL_61_9]HCM27888.1 type II toxin-antitoxin system prevent-host-death family antitoxin [Treponema sp.]